MKKKGIRYERELIKLLWDSGFAAVRVAGSGVSVFPSPDIVAGDGKRFLAFEVKSRKGLPLYISKEEVKQLVMFSNLFGAEAYIALKLPNSPWRFFAIDSLRETEKGFVVDEAAYASGADIYEVTGKSRQLRLEW